MALTVRQWAVAWHVVSLISFITIRANTTHSIQLQIPVSSSSAHSWNLFGQPGDGYYTQVKIGTPPQQFNILIDTGSSNFAIAGVAEKRVSNHFDPMRSSSYVDKGKEVKVKYSQGSWSGTLGRDVVLFPWLEPTTTPKMTDLVLINSSHDFYINNSEWQGIVGLAFPPLAKPKGAVQSWLDEAIIRNNLTDAFTLELCGPSREAGSSSHYGRLTLGSDESGCSLTTVSCPIKRKWFYEVIVTALSLQNKNLNVPCVKFNTDKSIVDSGTSNLLLPPEVYREVIKEFKQQTSRVDPPLPEEFWSRKEELCWPQNSKQWTTFPNLTIHLSSSSQSTITITVGPQSYLRPAPDSDVSSSLECWVLGIEESSIGTVLGAVILEGLCVTFHRAKGIITFSESTCGPTVILNKVYSTEDTSVCVYSPKRLATQTVASNIMGGILGLLSLPLAVAAFRWGWKKGQNFYLNKGIPFVVLNESNT